MKFLCLCYDAESVLDALPKSEWDEVVRNTYAYNEELRTRGHLLAAQSLQPVRTAVTVRVRGGRMSTTDGPFAETREQLGGFFLIEAKDMDEAVALASRLQGAQLGCIEVRPTRDLA